MKRHLLSLLATLSMLLCVAACVHGALARGRTYLLVSQSPGASHIAGILELKAILWLEDRRDPDVMVITLDRWTTGAGFLYGSRGQAYRVFAESGTGTRVERGREWNGDGSHFPERMERGRISFPADGCRRASVGQNSPPN